MNDDVLYVPEGTWVPLTDEEYEANKAKYGEVIYSPVCGRFVRVDAQRGQERPK